jgi:hypothetical protein
MFEMRTSGLGGKLFFYIPSVFPFLWLSRLDFPSNKY